MFARRQNRLHHTDSRGARAFTTDTFTVNASRTNMALYVGLMTESNSVFTLPIPGTNLRYN